MRLVQTDRSELSIGEPELEWPAECRRRQFTENAMAPSIGRIDHVYEPGPLHGERRLLHRRDLFAQLQDPRLPGARRIEPWECRRKSRVLPSARDPRRIVNQPQGAQRLDQVKFVRIEFG